MSAQRFSEKYHNTTFDQDFAPGKLVLVHNTRGAKDLGGKWKPRYMGPYIVLRQNQAGNYTLAELDGTVSKLRYAKKRIIPYFLRSEATIPIPNISLRDLETNDMEPDASGLSDVEE
jgi:hypothetical protein